MRSYIIEVFDSNYNSIISGFHAVGNNALEALESGMEQGLYIPSGQPYQTVVTNSASGVSVEFKIFIR